jgi:hypothetical protein
MRKVTRDYIALLFFAAITAAFGNRAASPHEMPCSKIKRSTATNYEGVQR